MGVPAAKIALFNDQHFQAGMQAVGAAELNDPAPATWEPGFVKSPIDAMLLLADDDEGFLLRQARNLIKEVSAFAEVVQIERGAALRAADGEGIEHFGYVDGRSQPIFFSTDLPGEGTTAVWDPLEPLEHVLVKDHTVSAADSFGSYFVFRKLEQNVQKFAVLEAALAQRLDLKGKDITRAGAMAVGRFKDGTPLVLSPTDGLQPEENQRLSFRYGDRWRQVSVPGSHPQDESRVGSPSTAAKQ